MITELGQLPNLILLLSIVLVVYYIYNGQLIEAIINKFVRHGIKNKNVLSVLNLLQLQRAPVSRQSNQINHFNMVSTNSSLQQIGAPNDVAHNVPVPRDVAHNVPVSHNVPVPRDVAHNVPVPRDAPNDQSIHNLPMDPSLMQYATDQDGETNSTCTTSQFQRAQEWDKMININESDFVKNERNRTPVYHEPIVAESSRINDNLQRLNAIMLGDDEAAGGNSNGEQRYTGTIEELYDEIVQGT